MRATKPLLSAWQVTHICIGAFGIQFGFALPQANATRIFQNLGASLDSVPLLWLAGPITGLLMALGTQWGLLRHYWVIISLALTVLSALVLILHMPDVSHQAAIAQSAEDGALATLGGDVVHPGVGLVVLLVIQVMNVYKPRGLTRYGWRRQQAQRTTPRAALRQ